MAADKTLACRDCGTEFVFTVGEQEFFAQKGFSEPNRCPACRAARKMERLRAQADEAAPGGFDLGGRSSRGGRDRGRERWDQEARPRRERW